jgi:hypothetical protein
MESNRTNPEPLTIHFTELAPGQPGSELNTEWEIYRREVGRLLSEGHEGRYVLIKCDQIIGIWNTREEARAAANKQFLGQAYLIHKIQARERLYRTPWIWTCRT